MQLHNTLNNRLTEDVPDGPSMPARPWSAAEPRWNADRMFSRFAVSNVYIWFIQTEFCSKQRNWEGLAAGRKHLHHGQLLPGSTESTDEDARPTKTCWSEGASPGRWEMQRRKTTLLPHIMSRPPPPTTTAMPDPATPLIQAIRSELRRFQRSQNTGVTIVTDPDLLDKESKAWNCRHLRCEAQCVHHLNINIVLSM